MHSGLGNIDDKQPPYGVKSLMPLDAQAEQEFDRWLNSTVGRMIQEQLGSREAMECSYLFTGS